MKQYKYLIFSVFTLMVCSMNVACSGGGEDDPTEEPNNQVIPITLTTPTITEVTHQSAVLTSKMSGNMQVLKKGFCYSSTNKGPMINDFTAEVTTAGNDLQTSLTDLKASTTYYVRAYATVSETNTYYSTVTSFVTGTNTSENKDLASYVAPTYADDYTSIADWSKRSQWNLANVHDPTVVLADDGYYYMYQTDASYGNAHEKGGHFHGRRSKDLVNWEYLGGTMKSLPDWVIPKLNEIRKAMGLPEVNPNKNSFGYWAPCVRKVKTGLYRMYYSIVCPGYIDNNKTSWSERAFIGMMENSDPANNDGWVDKGYVITNASDKQLNFYVKPDNWGNCYFKWNAIDPSYIITPEGKHWLIYGSWHSGFPAIELNAETGKPMMDLPNPWGNNNDIAPYGKLVATRKMGDRWQASEGPEVVYNPATGYYYLFVAYDALDVPYNTRVVRSKNVDGPYVGIDGTDVTNTGGDMYPIVTHPYKFSKGYGWVGISHCCVFDDGKGNWYYASQARFPANVGGNPYSNAIMMGHVRSIRWTEDGWPLVMPERYGAVPQIAITEEELVGNWEHIDLGYSYGNQKTSSVMTLGADHKITAGTWKGSSWSFDASKQILTANGVQLYVQRETDWEASPRKHTIVYVGLNKQKTYWGKKTN